MIMRERLEAIKDRYAELNNLISDPAVISKQSEWQKFVKEHSLIEPVTIEIGRAHV